jgi:DNA-binding MarR family transcriptional regulator
VLVGVDFISCYDTIVSRYMFIPPKEPDFHAMAELRYQIRQFLHFSETAARAEGLEPQQHQLLLAVKGLPDELIPTVSVLAERMQLQHHSTVGLIDRLASRGLLIRLRATDDRRQVLIKLTHNGEECLERLALHHLHELQFVGPKFVDVLQSLLHHSPHPSNGSSHIPRSRERNKSHSR